jgi:FlgD Ig-like domain
MKAACRIVALVLVTLAASATSTFALVHAWSLSYTGDSAQGIVSVATDAAGNIYAAGDFYNTTNFGGGNRTSNGGSDIVLVKLNSAGAYLWDLEFGDISDSQFATSVAVDNAGNVYVAGAFMGSVNFGGGVLTSLGDRDLFLAKFNSAGVHQWSKRFGDVAEQESRTIAVDPSGNVYWAGYFYGSVNFGGGALTSLGGRDAFLAKFDASGVHQWSKRVGDAGDQLGMAVATDYSGNVFFGLDFTGTINFGSGNLTTAGDFDIGIVKYNSAGTFQWQRQFGDAVTQEVTALATDRNNGSLYLTGSMVGTVNFGGGLLTGAGALDVYVAKLDANGAHLWSNEWGDADYQTPGSIATAPSGDVFITGSLNGTVDFGGGPLVSAGNQDVFIAQFSSVGSHKWSRSYGDAAKYQQGACVTADFENHVIMCGGFQGVIDFGGGPLTGNSFDAFLVEFGPDPTGVGNVPALGGLSISAHPNPFNPQTTIHYRVPAHGDVRLEVYNLRGEKVATLVNRAQDAGTFTATWNGMSDTGNAVSSGVYFARLTAAGATRSTKLVLLK